MQRLYFLTKNEKLCDEIEKSLVSEGVDANRIFIFDDLAEEMVSLPDSTVWTRKHTIPVFVYGILLGGFVAFLAGLLRLSVDEQLSTDLIIGVSVFGAFSGGVMFWLATSDEHEQRIEQFRKTVDLDGILMVVDVPKRLYRKLHTMVVARHPAKYLGSVAHTRLQN